MVGTENQRCVQQRRSARVPGLGEGASDSRVRRVGRRGDCRHEPENTRARLGDSLRVQIIGPQIISGSQRQRHLQTLECGQWRVGAGPHAARQQWLGGKQLLGLLETTGPEEGGDLFEGVRTGQINYHPQSGWFEEAPLKGGAVMACPCQGRCCRQPSQRALV